jgi:hypothetical protein
VKNKNYVGERLVFRCVNLANNKKSELKLYEMDYLFISLIQPPRLNESRNPKKNKHIRF